MEAVAFAFANAVVYRNAGTVELHVERPITEMRYGVDFVREPFRVAQGQPPSFGATPPRPARRRPRRRA